MSIFTRRADPILHERSSLREIEASFSQRRSNRDKLACREALLDESLVEKRGLTKNIKIPEFYNFVLLTEAL